MPIVQEGSVNLESVQVPNALVQIQPPQPIIQGVATNRIGVVGTANWGEVNSAATIGSGIEFIQNFGNPENAVFDGGTNVMVALQNGSTNFKFVRVTDGTDVAASLLLLDTAPATGATLTSKYTGILGNTTHATISAGTNSTPSALTYKLLVYMTGGLTEVYDNIGGTGAAFWTNLVAAVNLGQGAGPSNLVVATDGSGTAAPALAAYTATGGTSGNSGVTSSTIIGTDGLTRTGMYALRGSGSDIGLLSGLTDTTKWATVLAFAIQEDIFFHLSGAAGQQESISSFISTVNALGIDNYEMKIFLGDWCYWNDQFNNITRLVSPASFVAGALAPLAPNQSSLNLPLVGIVATQKTADKRHYSDADLLALQTARIDVVTNPVPGGNYFASRLGVNTSSNILTKYDSYTRMNNFLGSTFEIVMGKFVGKANNPEVQLQVTALFTNFLTQMLPVNLGGTLNYINGFIVVCNSTNNPLNRVALGFLQANVRIQLQQIIVLALVNLDANGNVSVTITPA